MVRDETLDSKVEFNFTLILGDISVKVQLELWVVTEMNGANGWNLYLLPNQMETLALADSGGGAGTCPPKGPDSFVLTYKFFGM